MCITCVTSQDSRQESPSDNLDVGQGRHLWGQCPTSITGDITVLFAFRTADILIFCTVPGHV